MYIFNQANKWSILSIFVIAILLSYFILTGSGYSAEYHWFHFSLLAVIFILLAQHKIGIWGILLPIVLIYGIYTPIGLTFGPPSYQYVASVFATDLQESQEFFAQIPSSHYLASGTIFGLFCLFIRLTSRLNQLCEKLPLGYTILAVSLSIFFFISTPVSKLIKQGYFSTREVMQELSRLNSMAIESEWGQSQLVNSQYDDYILVIGESARKDYHHAYGYPIENTPFMSSANGILIDGLTASGTNTIASLKLMLTQPDTEKWQGNYALTLVDLVKSAGIKTTWLSNQGYLGTFDTPISSIANKSDETYFLKSGDSFSQNISDFALLPKFQQLIQQPYTGKRFWVVHLYGSHPISCDRLTDYPKIYDDEKINPKYHDIHCYISSIKKTDTVLACLYQILKQNQQQHQRTFSLVYFADHGLAHHFTDNHIAIHNSSGKSKLHFDVPLFKISSDDTERKVYQAVKSGLNFTNGIANWIGIRNPKLNIDLDLFSPTTDPNDYGLKTIIDSFDVPLDPAIPLYPD